MRVAWAVVALALAVGFAPGRTRADDWDLALQDDDEAGSSNELEHGSEQVHDLGVPFQSALTDQDWYSIESRPLSSYQVVVDGMTGDLDLAAGSLRRFDVTGVASLQTSVASDFGGVLGLEWQQGATPALHNVRVSGAACGLACGTEQQYRIRFYDTTYSVARFNNTGTQSTVLLVQNATDRACAVTYHFVGAGGALLASVASELTPRELEVVPAAASAPGQSGSVRVTHTCGVGGLSGKAVSLEPATGFAFDTALVERRH